MNKLFNRRPIVMCAVALMLGISIYLFSVNFKFVSLILVSAVSITVLVFFLSRSNSVSLKLRSLSVYISLFLVLGFFLGFIADSSYKSANVNEEVYIITGRVTDKSSAINNGRTSVILSDVTMVSTDSGKVVDCRYDMRAFITITNDETFSDLYKTGDYIRYKAKVYNNPLIDGLKINTYNYKINVKTFSYTSDLLIENTGKNKVLLAETVRQATKHTIYSNMDEEEAAVAYAMMFGDTTNVSQTVMDSFKTSGMLHILAISGLHVVFLILLLNIILARFKAKPLTRLIIIGVVIFIYSYLCGFSPSVVRAYIMSMVVLFCSFRGKRYDAFNSLALSAILILLFRPFYMFDLGFVMSFSAVLAIICLLPVLGRWFSKFMTPGFASSLGLIVASQIGVFPWLVYTGSKVTVYSVLCNLLAVPVSSIAYIIMLCTLVISLILPFIAVLLQAVGFMFGALIKIADITAFFTVNKTNTTMSAIATFLWYAGLLAASHFNLKNDRVKVITVTGLFAGAIILFLV